MEAYQDYLLGSRGELSIAKNVYVATRSGWFSTRSAAYLACGKPVVVQDTGFPAHVPTGPGLHAFSTADEAVAALAAIRADYRRACRHARETAEAHFAAGRVCARLLADAGL
jgi:glycosyltransferase involved in cell wall biosynthesis